MRLHFSGVFVAGAILIAVGSSLAAAGPEMQSRDAPADFAPCPRVLFFDDFGGYELREFPHWWERESGRFEIGARGLDRVAVCLESGRMRPKLPPGPLPARYSVEVEIYGNAAADPDQTYRLVWVDDDGGDAAELALDMRGGLRFRARNERAVYRQLPAGRLGGGLHAMQVQIEPERAICYFDGVRVFAAGWSMTPGPVGLRIGGVVADEEVPCLFSSFRLTAETD